MCSIELNSIQLRFDHVIFSIQFSDLLRLNRKQKIGWYSLTFLDFFFVFSRVKNKQVFITFFFPHFLVFHLSPPKIRKKNIKSLLDQILNTLDSFFASCNKSKLDYNQQIGGKFQILLVCIILSVIQIVRGRKNQKTGKNE